MQHWKDKMKIAFIRPNYPNEVRVALLPGDLAGLQGTGLAVVVESGFGAALDIPDAQYQAAGAVIASQSTATKNAQSSTSS